MGTIQSEMSLFNLVETVLAKSPDEWVNARDVHAKLLELAPNSQYTSTDVSNKLRYMFEGGNAFRRPSQDASFTGKYDYRLARKAVTPVESVRRPRIDTSPADIWMANNTSVEKPLSAQEILHQCHADGRPGIFPTISHVYTYVASRRKSKKLLRVRASDGVSQYAYYWKKSAKAPATEQYKVISPASVPRRVPRREASLIDLAAGVKRHDRIELDVKGDSLLVRYNGLDIVIKNAR